MFKKLIVLTFLSAQIAGCGIRQDVPAAACDWASPIWISRQDHLSAETLRQIVIHNETGERLCGWGS